MCITRAFKIKSVCDNLWPMSKLTGTTTITITITLKIKFNFQLFKNMF